MPSTESLSIKLGYPFIDISLLTSALTHRSAATHNNERLEFLGDAIVNFVVGEALFKQFPQAQEGELSRLRAALVCQESLADIARDLTLGEYLLLGPGELKSGGHRRDSILSDALEAVVAAIYLDSDITKTSECVLRWFGSRIAQSALLPLKDPKTRLQEFLQSRKKVLPQYDVVNIEGHDHDQLFTVHCSVVGIMPTVGTGKNRRVAEQMAAEAALEQLENMRGKRK